MWRIATWFPKLDPKLLTQLKGYHAELMKFNMKVNLISRNTEREADEAHFADCLLAAEIIFKSKLPKRIHDIGSGNGFPGLILAMMDSSREFMLVESDSRKAEFLKHVSHILDLKNVNVLNVRFDTLLGQELECGISRGFASISKTVLACNRAFRPGGILLHLKGSSWSSEVAELPSQLISAWKPQLVGDYSLPISQARRAIVSTQKI